GEGWPKEVRADTRSTPTDLPTGDKGQHRCGPCPMAGYGPTALRVDTRADPAGQGRSGGAGAVGAPGFRFPGGQPPSWAMRATQSRYMCSPNADRNWGSLSILSKSSQLSIQLAFTASFSARSNSMRWFWGSVLAA